MANRMCRRIIDIHQLVLLERVRVRVHSGTVLCCGVHPDSACTRCVHIGLQNKNEKLTLRFSDLVVQPFIVGDQPVDTLPINPFPLYAVQNDSMYYVDDCAPLFSAGEHCFVAVCPQCVAGPQVATGVNR
jgi:hypothetical protein